MFKDKKVLVLAPHTDDAEFGCGGTISRVMDEGGEVYVVAFCDARESLPKNYEPGVLQKEFSKAMDMLRVNYHCILGFKVRQFHRDRQEILDEMINLRDTHKPDIVLLPCSHDTHQDHKTIHEEGFRAFKTTTMLGYEMPGNNLIFTSTGFVEINDSQLARKAIAIKYYKSQLDRKPMEVDAIIEGQARLRGWQIHKSYAEAFEVIRWVV